MCSTRQRLITFAITILCAIPINLSAAQLLADAQSRREALDLYRAGREYMSAEQFERAAETFGKAIEKDQLLTVAHYGLGQAFMGLRRFQSAILAYKKCLDAVRRLHDLEQTTKFEVEKQRDDEIRELRHEINQVPASSLNDVKRSALEGRLHDLEAQRSTIGGSFRPPSEVLLALGSAFFRNGNQAEAEAEWKAAIEVNPKLGEAHNNLAVVYMQTGRLQEAEQELKLAEKSGFRVNPQFKEDLKQRKKQ